VRHMAQANDGAVDASTVYFICQLAECEEVTALSESEIIIVNNGIENVCKCGGKLQPIKILIRGETIWC
jgi:hypothetical protein